MAASEEPLVCVGGSFRLTFSGQQRQGCHHHPFVAGVGGSKWNHKTLARTKGGSLVHAPLDSGVYLIRAGAFQQLWLRLVFHPQAKLRGPKFPLSHARNHMFFAH